MRTFYPVLWRLGFKLCARVNKAFWAMFYRLHRKILLQSVMCIPYHSASYTTIIAYRSYHDCPQPQPYSFTYIRAGIHVRYTKGQINLPNICSALLLEPIIWWPVVRSIYILPVYFTVLYGSWFPSPAAAAVTHWYSLLFIQPQQIFTRQSRHNIHTYPETHINI